MFSHSTISAPLMICPAVPTTAVPAVCRPCQAQGREPYRHIGVQDATRLAQVHTMEDLGLGGRILTVERTPDRKTACDRSQQMAPVYTVNKFQEGRTAYQQMIPAIKRARNGKTNTCVVGRNGYNKDPQRGSGFVGCDDIFKLNKPRPTPNCWMFVASL